MNNRGILIVLSGFSGAGKGTVVKNILKTYPDEYAVSVSATTRAPREGETDGREYFFKSTSEFQKMIATGELIEYAQYVGNYYGTPRRYVEEQLEAGKLERRRRYRPQAGLYRTGNEPRSQHHFIESK